jgi:hypothetical protein
MQTNGKCKMEHGKRFARSMVELLLTVAVIALVVALFSPPVVRAQPSIGAKYQAYSTVGVALGGSALTNYAIIGANTVSGGAPVVTFLDAQAVGTAAFVQFYDCTNVAKATAATTNTRTNAVNTTNGFTTGTVVVVRHMTNDTYERLLCTASPAAGQIAFVSDPVTALRAGDLIYQQTATGKIPINTTNAGSTISVTRITGRCIYAGKPGVPLLADVVTATGTNGVINAMSAVIEP